VLVLDYLRTTETINPELEMMAESYVGEGYQRLLTFETPEGGFTLFGDAPGDVFLTAYGLMEFSDMARVYPVDEALIERTARWLLDRQQPNGTWLQQGYSEHWAIGAELPTTAYITWALVQAGYADTMEVGRAISYLREFSSQAEDPYGLGLVANALAAYDAEGGATRAAVERLYDMRIEDGDEVYWGAGAGSYLGATGDSGAIESTALAATALMQANAHSDAVSGALAYLVGHKDPQGTWGTTQATILALKALLLASATQGQAEGPATIQVSLNKELTEEITIDETNADVVHSVTFERGFSPTGANRVQVALEGGGNLMMQVTTRYYLPWDAVPAAELRGEMVTVDVGYDRTQLAVNDEATAQVRVRVNEPGVVRLALVDLGIPPGFTVLSEDLARLVEGGVIARYELTGRQIILYLEDFSSERPLSFSYRLRARFPMRAKTPSSSAYDYYNPGDPTVREPVEMVVVEG
jgi:uncharacterized protein YfaS (alpha-2-macroglobulin family)